MRQTPQSFNISIFLAYQFYCLNQYTRCVDPETAFHVFGRGQNIYFRSAILRSRMTCLLNKLLRLLTEKHSLKASYFFRKSIVSLFSQRNRSFFLAVYVVTAPQDINDIYAA